MDAYKTYKVASKIVIENGQTIWRNIGSLVIYENGTGKLRLNMFTNEQYHVFDKDLDRDNLDTGQKKAISRAQAMAEE